MFGVKTNRFPGPLNGDVSMQCPRSGARSDCCCCCCGCCCCCRRRCVLVVVIVIVVECCCFLIIIIIVGPPQPRPHDSAAEGHRFLFTFLRLANVERLPAEAVFCCCAPFLIHFCCQAACFSACTLLTISQFASFSNLPWQFTV